MKFVAIEMPAVPVMLLVYAVMVNGPPTLAPAVNRPLSSMYPPSLTDHAKGGGGSITLPSASAATAVNLPAGWEADAWSAVAKDFKVAVTDVKSKPAAVQAKLAEKLAKDYAVPLEYVQAALAA